LGDQVTLRSLLTDANAMWMGTLGYSVPLGASGLRGNVSYAHTYYELGDSFAVNQSTGTADVASLGLSYPLLRSEGANLSLSGGWQDKQLNDKNGLAKTSADKTGTSLPLNLSFDARDGMGVTYGSLSWTSGEVKLLDANQLASDSQAKTNGSFDKINLDIARQQALNSRFTLLARLSAQGASKNLDSSEDFGLGGANGVRAYPSGEAYGDVGWLTQLELHYSAGAHTPYAFYDAGNVTTNTNPWVGSGANERKLAGVGLGSRYQRGGWNADAAVAWRLEGGVPQADDQDKRETGPQVWMHLGYKF
jgi:hemolysin activation/secretion protein